MIVIGHRGSVGFLPENSLNSCRYAIDMKLDGFEIDVHLSADGEIVVYHDFQLTPQKIYRLKQNLINQSYILKHLTLAQIQTFRLKQRRYDPLYKHIKVKDQQAVSEGIPTLQQILTLVKTHAPSTFKIWIELKTDPTRMDLSSDPQYLVSKLQKTINTFDLWSQIVVLSFDWQTLHYLQKSTVKCTYAYLTTEHHFDDTIYRNRSDLSPWLGGQSLQAHQGSIAKMIRSLNGHIWAVDYRDLTQDCIKTAHTCGLQVYAWTVNHLTVMKKLQAWGVDGIITDHPLKWPNFLNS